MISQWTIASALQHLGPMSMEALACYLRTARSPDFTPEELAVEVNTMIEQERVVLLSEHNGMRLEPFWVGLAHPSPCILVMGAFDHLTIWQATRLQDLRTKYDDYVVATAKVANQLGCTQAQIAAFMRHNRHPDAA